MAITTAMKKIEATLYEPTSYKVIQGGMSAGKTFAIITLLVGYCQSYPHSIVTVAGMSYRHLSKGPMRDFQKILEEANIWNNDRFNKTEKEYKFENGSILEFLSLDDGSARGPRRDVVFINEANYIDYDTFRQLKKRSRDFCIIDYNPSSEFWAHTKLVNNDKKRKDVSFLILTYKDNEALTAQEIRNIEEERPAPGEPPSNWWTVYGLGQIGSLEGNVYEGWTAIDEIPKGWTLARYGVDFGFSNDPTAVVGVYANPENDNEIALKVHIYAQKLLTPQLIAKCKELPSGLFVCDNARPEIIAEMQANGLRAIGCDKTAGEKMNGKRYNIELVLRRKVYYLSTDKELEREYLSYAWRKKRTGEVLDEPEDGNDHCMDAIAYAVRDLSRRKVEYGGVR